MATSAYNYIESTGTIVPDTADINQDVIDEYTAAFGQDLVTTPDTPQGVVITAEVTARDSVARNNADLANQINPNIAGGIFLDAICALTGLVRSAGTATTIGANYTGLAGTVVSTGVQVSFTVSGVPVVFSPTDPVTLDVDGLGSGELQALVNGPYSIASGVTATIVNGVIGLETVVSSAQSVPGTSQQSDAALRQSRRLTLAGQGNSVAEAITSGLYALSAVRSLSFRENYENTAQIIDGILLDPHSIFVCVDADDTSTNNDDIAGVLLDKKTGGTGYSDNNGTPVTVQLIDLSSGQTQTIIFTRPTAIPIEVQITASAGTYTGDAESTIVSAILAYINDELGIGDDVSPFEIANAVNTAASGIFVTSVAITTVVDNDFEIAVIPIALYENATITVNDIEVTIA